jgi:hypothetical protein
MTTGIFAWIAAHAGESENNKGERHHPLLAHVKEGWCFERKISWRSRSAKDAFREREEHKVITEWKKYVVLNYEKSLVQV